MGWLISSGSNITDFEQILSDPLIFLRIQKTFKNYCRIIVQNNLFCPMQRYGSGILPSVFAILVHNMISGMLLKVVFLKIKEQ